MFLEAANSIFSLYWIRPIEYHEAFASEILKVNFPLFSRILNVAIFLGSTK